MLVFLLIGLVLNGKSSCLPEAKRTPSERAIRVESIVNMIMDFMLTCPAELVGEVEMMKTRIRVFINSNDGFPFVMFREYFIQELDTLAVAYPDTEEEDIMLLECPQVKVLNRILDGGIIIQAEQMASDTFSIWSTGDPPMKIGECLGTSNNASETFSFSQTLDEPLFF
jgi:hypothetical protein